MRSSEDDGIYYSFLDELIDRNLISDKVIFSIENISGKELLRIDDTTNIEDLLSQPLKIADGVGEADTITYSLPGTEIGEYLPSNYKRVIIKFIPEEQASPEPTTPLNVLTNPKTFNNILGIVGLITIISLGTILTKRITKTN